MDNGSVWEGVRRMLPIAVAGLPEGVAFGALATSVIGHVAPVAMSLTAFSGSAQYATVSVLRGGGTLAAALLAALVVASAVSDGQRLVLDPRLAGVAAGAAVAFARGPLLLVIVVAAGVTALIRAVT